MNRRLRRHPGPFTLSTPPVWRIAGIALAGLLMAAPCAADSVASSASSAGSKSVGSVSDSFRGSSNSSTGGDKKLADGNYRIVDIAEVTDRAGMTRLSLRSDTGDRREWQLDLPTQTFAKQALARGDVVSATQRLYGYEFARGDTREAFFLVLTDDWRGDLDARPVTL